MFPSFTSAQRLRPCSIYNDKISLDAWIGTITEQNKNSKNFTLALLDEYTPQCKAVTFSQHNVIALATIG